MIRRLGILAIPAAALILFGCEAMDKLKDLVANTKVSMTMKNGEKLEGTLLRNGDGGSTVQIKYGSVTVTSGEVVHAEQHSPAPEPSAGNGRLAKWDKCLRRLAAADSSVKLAPIPATVIDKGIFRNVPYLSHRSGEVEFNVYGDPDEPCGLEIGIHNRAPILEARQECVRIMLSLLSNPSDADALKSLDLDEAKVEHQGITFEVTPSTADDAYGAWWISIYDTRVVNQQRASDKELPQITVGRGGASNGAAPASGILKWKEHELKLARPVPSGAGEGRVFLRGVHRKNGAYVAPKSL